jgi:hypothetical protein
LKTEEEGEEVVKEENAESNAKEGEERLRLAVLERGKSQNKKEKKSNGNLKIVRIRCTDVRLVYLLTFTSYKN